MEDRKSVQARADRYVLRIRHVGADRAALECCDAPAIEVSAQLVPDPRNLIALRVTTPK
jgi:hypothetical protein